MITNVEGLASHTLILSFDINGILDSEPTPVNGGEFPTIVASSDRNPTIGPDEAARKRSDRVVQARKAW